MTSKTKMLKKGAYTAKNRNMAAPAKKAEKTPKKEPVMTTPAKMKMSKNKERRNRLCLIRRQRMLKKGIPEEVIKQLEADEKVRTITCLVYGSYHVEVDEKKSLHGVAAIEHFLKNNLEKDTYTVLNKSGVCLYLKTTEDHAESIAEKLREMGRVIVMKWHKKEEPKKKDKKPTNNTSEVKKEAKQTRKEDKKARADMRPYYAARRNFIKADGKLTAKEAVSKRIRIHNPKLAEDIEKWILANPKDMKRRKNKGTGIGRHRNKHPEIKHMSTLERRLQERAKRAGRHVIALEKKKATESVKSAKNAKKKATAAVRAAAKKEQNIKFAA